MIPCLRREYIFIDNDIYDKAFVKKNTSILFGVAFSIFLVVSICRTSFLANCFMLDNDDINKYILFGVVCVLALKEYLSDKHTLKLLVHIVVILLLTVLIKSVNSFAAAASLIVIYSSRNEDFKYIARIALFITTIMLLMIIVFSLVGVIENYQLGDESTRLRCTLGFRYVLYPSAYLFNIIALILYLYRKKVMWITIIIETLASIWIYKMTDSRLSFGFTMIVLVASIVVKIPYNKFCFGAKKRYINNYFGKIIKMCIVLSFVLCAIFSIVVTIRYNEGNKLQNRINSAFSNRLYYGQKSYQEYGVKLFGQKIEWIGNGLNSEGEKSEGDYLYVDNLYLQFLQRYGIVFFAFVLILLTISMKILINRKEWMLVFIMLLLATHSMIDDLILHLWYNTFWLALAPLLINDSFLIKLRGYYIDNTIQQDNENIIAPQ